MLRKTPIPTASLVAVIAAIGLIATSALAEPEGAGMRVTSSDATSRFVVIGINKSLVIDLPSDVHNVLLSDPKIVSLVVRSKRRVYINGMAVGNANVYLFGADDRLIGGLDIRVQTGSPPAAWENYAFPANGVVFYRGATEFFYSCTPIACVGGDKPGAASAGGGSPFSFFNF
jgi:Flp pilus assembly secretin CpaC